MQPKEKLIHLEGPERPWEVLGADIIPYVIKKYLCIVDLYNKFSIIKMMKGLSADNLILTCKVIFWNGGCPRT